MSAPSFQHRLLLYRSDAELLTAASTFLREGWERGEMPVVACGPRLSHMLNQRLPSELDTVFHLEHSSPLPTVESRRRMVGDLDAGRRVRMVGEVPHPGTHPQPWEPWAQYEAAINYLYGDLPLTVLCVYDRATVPAGVRDDVMRSHPVLVEGGLARANPSFQPPRESLRQQVGSREPREDGPPQVEMAPIHRPAAVRARLRTAARRQGLDGPAVDDFVLAVNEVVSEALTRQAGPISVSAWLHPDRLIGHVGYPQEAPDPLSGFLVPSFRDNGKLRLPIARRFAGRVDVGGGPARRVRVVTCPRDYAEALGDPLITQVQER